MSIESEVNNLKRKYANLEQRVRRLQAKLNNKNNTVRRRLFPQNKPKNISQQPKSRFTVVNNNMARFGVAKKAPNAPVKKGRFEVTGSNNKVNRKLVFEEPKKIGRFSVF